MTDNNVIRLATRGSALAQWQADRVSALIRERQPGLQVEKVIISTKPDRIQDKSLEALGGDKGLFVKEVEQAVLDGRADAAVHSLKDVPVEGMEQALALIAFPERADAADVLLSRRGKTLDELPAGSVVATGAPRRQAQLLALRPDLKVCGVRGNVETRVRKLHAGEFDAIIMAAAGLKRLGMDEEITEVLSLDMFVPAPGQGIVVVQARPDSQWTPVWSELDDPKVRFQAETEREFSRLIGADCHSAAGCFLESSRDGWIFRATVCSADGATRLSHQANFRLGTTSTTIAGAAATALQEQGAQDLL